MKKRHAFVVAAGLALAAALVLFWLIRPSNLNTTAFFSRHEALLEDFISLCREEAVRPDEKRRLIAIYTDFFSNTLVTCRQDPELLDHEEHPTSPELRAGWEAIQRRRYFTSVSCSFDENGALEIHFSAEGEWVPYGTPTEGHYRIAHCLLWRDADYEGRSSEGWWHSLDGSDGQGFWYYTCHKHRDG